MFGIMGFIAPGAPHAVEIRQGVLKPIERVVHLVNVGLMLVVRGESGHERASCWGAWSNLLLSGFLVPSG